MNLINRRIQNGFCQKDEGSGAMKSLAPQPPDTLKTSAPKAIPKTVLIVDDDALFLAMLSDPLIARGAKVLTTTKSIDVLDNIRQEFAEGRSVDILVVDYAMPDVDGLDIALAVRTCFPSVKVAFVTGAPDLLEMAIEDANGDTFKKALLDGVMQLGG
jgi:CheY-like chemotaxis protein